jgi:hypothetical protein
MVIATVNTAVTMANAPSALVPADTCRATGTIRLVSPVASTLTAVLDIADLEDRSD